MQGGGPGESSLQEASLPRVVVGEDSGWPMGPGGEGPEEVSRGPCPLTCCLLDFPLPSSHPYSLQLFGLLHLLQTRGCRLSSALISLLLPYTQPSGAPPPAKPCLSLPSESLCSSLASGS